MHHDAGMPDPFWLILGFIAIACLALYPIRVWRQRHHDYGDEPGGDPVPLAPPKRRND